MLDSPRRSRSRGFPRRGWFARAARRNARRDSARLDTLRATKILRAAGVGEAGTALAGSGGVASPAGVAADAGIADGRIRRPFPGAPAPAAPLRRPAPRSMLAFGLLRVGGILDGAGSSDASATAIVEPVGIALGEGVETKSDSAVWSPNCGGRSRPSQRGGNGTGGPRGPGDRERRPSHAPPGLVPRERRAPATEAAPRRPVRTANSVPFVSFGEKRPGRRARLLRSRRARADHRVPADGSERESPLTGRSAGPPR